MQDDEENKNLLGSQVVVGGLAELGSGGRKRTAAHVRIGNRPLFAAICLCYFEKLKR